MAILSVMNPIALSDKEFVRIQKMMLTYAGVTLGPTKHQMAFNRLSRQLRASQMNSFDLYLNQVEKSAELRQFFIDALTTNVTSFYREDHHFQFLSEWMKQRNKNGLNLSSVRGWSAGCSSGEEPISILTTLVDAAGSSLLPKQPIILASDIDSQVLNKARTGAYSNESLTSVKTVTRERYFAKVNVQDSQLKPAYKHLIEYQSINLNQPNWLFPTAFKSGSLQFVFCRNVMIYFNAETQKKLLRRIHESLEPGGLLFSGHSEMLLHSDDLFESLGKTTFRARDLRNV